MNVDYFPLCVCLVYVFYSFFCESFAFYIVEIFHFVVAFVNDIVPLFFSKIINNV
jgi:hypothetical protein